MNIEYCILNQEEINDYVRETFGEMLRKQGKVQGNSNQKADRCMLICLAKVNGTLIAIGSIKRKTESDFTKEKACVPELSNQFEWELGYLYTDPKYGGIRVGSNVAKLLVETYGKGNLMASTEISANPQMVRILEGLGFKHYGKSWKSAIHGNCLGLFLRFE